MSRYFTLYLEDYSASPLCPGTKKYYANKQELSDFLKAIENTKENSNVTISQKAVNSIEQTVITLNEYQWEHINTWGFPYIMKAQKIIAEQILLKIKNKYYRCVKPTFTRLQYSTEKTDWMPIGNNLWGFPNIFEIKGDQHRYRLYVIEQEYTSIDDAQADMTDTSKIIFKNVCGDVFGDG